MATRSRDNKDDVELEHFEPGDDKGVAGLTAADALGQKATGYEGLGPLATVRTFKMATLYSVMATFAAACDGYQIGLNGNIIANLGFIRQFATETSATTGQPIMAAPVLTAIGTIQSVGQVIGMTTMPFITARFGRKAGLYGLWFYLVLSVLFETVAYRWELWMIGKLFSGMGVGSLQFLTPTYVTEIAPARIRGAIILSYSWWFSFGQLMASIALQRLSKVDPYNWKVPVYTQWAQIGLMIIIYIILPESPSWCAGRPGNEDKGKQMLLRLNRGLEGYNVEQQWDVLVSAVQYEEQVARENKSEAWYNIFRGTNGFRTLISLWPGLSFQLVGLTLFSTYGAYFFRQAGLADPFAVTCIKSGIGLGMNIVAILLVEKFGRRLFCCSGLTLMLLMNLAIGVLGTQARSSVVDNLLVFFSVMWSVGSTWVASTSWLYIGEISSQRLRAHTAGFGAASTAIMGIIMNVLVPYMLTENKWNWSLKTGFFYLGVGAPFAIGSWFILPDAGGRTPAELDELFERKVKPWRFSKTKTALQEQLALERDGAQASGQTEHDVRQRA